jgi:hypothetical protein
VTTVAAVMTMAEMVVAVMTTVEKVVVDITTATDGISEGTLVGK